MVKIAAITPGGLAAACGLQVGDTVQTINGKLASTIEGSLSEIKKSVGDVTVGIAPRAGATAPQAYLRLEAPQAPKFDVNTGQPIQQPAAKFDVYTGKPIEPAAPSQAAPTPQPSAQPVQTTEPVVEETPAVVEETPAVVEAPGTSAPEEVAVEIKEEEKPNFFRAIGSIIGVTQSLAAPLPSTEKVAAARAAAAEAQAAAEKAAADLAAAEAQEAADMKAAAEKAAAEKAAAEKAAAEKAAAEKAAAEKRAAEEAAAEKATAAAAATAKEEAAAAKAKAGRDRTSATERNPSQKDAADMCSFLDVC